MQASGRNCLYASLALALLSLAVPRAHAETLTISSAPLGATVEIDGSVVGTTPYQIAYPGGYFHKTHTVFGSRLEHAMIARIYKEGYAAQKVTLTSGPYEWVAVTGRHHGTFYLLKSEHFDVKLETGHEAGRDPLEADASAGPIHPHPSASALLNEGGAPPDSGTVTIDSDPPRADIYVDWKFAGQTPSTIRLVNGPHHIELKSRGKQNWERELQVGKGSQITLHPVLEALP
jgi:hypothetical protein